MTRYYASLWDMAYCAKGVALYESLLRNSSADFCLYVLALDRETRDTLVALDLKQAIIVESWHVEKEMGLAAVKAERTHQEWCWTMASQFCDFLMRSGLREISYLDADLFAFTDPEVLFEEIGERSIGIVEHHLIPSKKHLEVNGRFNVGFVHFKNTDAGRACLNRWQFQVRVRCSTAIGCGDQQYLDEWPGLYGEECHVMQNIGAGVAPWNVGNWRVTWMNDLPPIVKHAGPCVDNTMICFYHFHELGYRKDGSLRLTNYELRKEDVDLIYAPYLSEYGRAKERIAGVYVS